MSWPRDNHMADAMRYATSQMHMMRPIPIHFAGFRSDTVTLQRCGWQFAASQDYLDDAMRILLRHPQLGLTGSSPAPSMGYRELVHDPEIYSRPIEVQIAHQYRIDERSFEMMSAMMEPVDMVPRMIDTSRLRDISELKVFQPVNQDAKQIYLSEASMSDILEVALSKQEDKQDEIRERMLRDKRLQEMRQDATVQAELRLVI